MVPMLGSAGSRLTKPSARSSAGVGWGVSRWGGAYGLFALGPGGSVHLGHQFPRLGQEARGLKSWAWFLWSQAGGSEDAGPRSPFAGTRAGRAFLRLRSWRLLVPGEAAEQAALRKEENSGS